MTKAAVVLHLTALSELEAVVWMLLGPLLKQTSTSTCCFLTLFAGSISKGWDSHLSNNHQILLRSESKPTLLHKIKNIFCSLTVIKDILFTDAKRAILQPRHLSYCCYTYQAFLSSTAQMQFTDVTNQIRHQAPVLNWAFLCNATK